MYFLTNKLDYIGLFDYICIVNLYNLSQNGHWFLVKMTKIFNQVKHLVKMANDL
jgi:hypothetical protein